MPAADNTRFQDRRITIRRGAWFRLVLTLLAAIAAFAAAQVSHLRLDWTEDHIYTLSDSTRSILAQLDEPIMVHAYITADLPQPYGRLRRFIEDMLISFHDAGGGKFGYEIIDPASDPNIAASLNAMGIPKVRVQVIENDQAQIKQGYLALVIEYLDNKETIPIVQGEEGFEYLLTRKIKKLTGKGRAKIGLVSAFGARDRGELGRLLEIAGDDYEFVDVDPDQRPIPADVQALIIAGMRQKPSEAFRYRVDQFRMAGHGLLLLAGNAVPQLSLGFVAQPVDAYTNDWLRSDLGVSVEPGLVLDQQAARIVVNQRQGQFLLRTAVDYPFVIHATDLDAQHPVTQGLESLTIPFASPLAWTEKAGNNGKVLARSSAYSTVQSGPPFDVDPLRSIQSRFSGVQLRPSKLILAYDAAADSAFKQKPEGLKSESEHIPHTEHARLLVIGSPAMLDDEFMDEGNMVFALNALDWLTGDEALIALRSRGVTDRPLAPLDNHAKAAWKGFWMFGLPGLVVIAGLARWWRLRRSRRFHTDSGKGEQ